MKSDYDILKDKYSERMAKACRSLFPTLFEKNGVISKLMLEKFYPNPTIYEDLVLGKNNSFKNFIYGFYNIDEPTVKTNKTVEELMDEAGYKIYECHDYDELASFKKYYQKNELLCSFSQDRLSDCRVFFAVKKDVDKIKREDFKIPFREDLYGTSVMSIQFEKGKNNALSIKNRYNHKVSNPDATLENNLENLVPGLTYAFEKEYGLNITKPEKSKLHLLDYTLASDGRYYKFNYEINGVYYCPNNIIINNGNVLKADSSRYKLLDYLLVDYHNKSISLYDDMIDESFKFRNLRRIDVKRIKDSKNTKMDIVTENDETISIIYDESSRIISLSSNDVTKIPDNYLSTNIYIESFNYPNALSIGDNFLNDNERLVSFNLNKVRSIGNECLVNNDLLLEFNLPEVLKTGDRLLFSNDVITSINTPKCEVFGDECFASNNSVKHLELPNTKVIGNDFFGYRNTNITVDIPNLRQMGMTPFGGNSEVYCKLMEVINENARRVNQESESNTTTSRRHK